MDYMFKALIEKMQKITREQVSFDPSSFNDQVALQTDWTPAKGGGASFRTHRLVVLSSDRREFRASFGAKLFYLVFLLVGLGVMIAFSYSNLSSGEFVLNAALFMPVLIGLIFSGVGGAMFYFGTAPIVFDKRKGYFWKGRKVPDEVFDKSSIKHFTKLERVHAIQLISEYCRGNKSSYYSYELNLVLEDGQRINVVDHGNENRLREDAGNLSDFLGKPVWNAI